MQITKQLHGENVSFELSHKQITAYAGPKNVTAENKDMFEEQMGYFSEQTESWIFPSPLDAIRAFERLRA